MRHRTFFLLSFLAIGILVRAVPAPAYYGDNSYSLERTNISGYVLAVENQTAYIETDYGDEIAVLLGPASYWNANDYYLPEGEYVEMEVWYDPTDRYTDWYFVGEIWGPDFHFVLANNEGVPFWVIFADDYYYSLGYRASCISYMIWFDCPPVYFVYLILPPPPPSIYICYYGPHWRHHHHDWHHGPRYCRGGTYWNDGRGHERPSHRPGRRAKNYDRWNDGRTGDNSSVSSDDDVKRQTSGKPPVVGPKARSKEVRKQPAQSQRSYERKATAPRNDTRNNSVRSKPSAERKVYAPKPEPQKRQVQSRSNDRAKQDVRGTKVFRRETSQEQGKSQSNQQYRTTQKEHGKSQPSKQYRTSKSEKRDSVAKRGRDTVKGKR